MMTTLVCSISITILVLLEIILLTKVTRLRKYAYADDLTGIKSFRGFSLHIKPLISNANRENAELTIAIVDIDNFRRFNHESYRLGDAVLKEFCILLVASLPPDSLVARFKIGDEFIIAFPNTAKASAEQHLKTLLAICASSDFNCLNGLPGFSVSFSFGISVYTPKEDLDAAIERAEQSLKAHKGHSTKHTL
jgi:diguanylate cyclase (GGDEF)-like protein